MKVTDVSHSRKQVLKPKPKEISKPKKVIGPKPDVALAHKPINFQNNYHNQYLHLKA